MKASDVRIMLKQGIDGSARKPAFIQDTEFMVEQTSYLAKYLGAFMAYLMPQCMPQGMPINKQN